MSLALASYRSLLYLLNLGEVQPMFEALVPWFAWNRDWVIVAVSAWLTIDLIPVTLVWAVASRFARWFILCMAALQFLVAVYDTLLRAPDVSAVLIATTGSLVPVVLAGLLFLPPSDGWFRVRRENEIAGFE